MTKTEYRADIDGLRAIAVLSVLFFHSGISAFSGGYTGVDIFFVISGYLITSIIVKDINNNNFSFTRFYERRFRRILPALTVVMAFTIAVGILLLDTNKLYELGKSVIATTLFSSNIFFYHVSGYFDTPAETKPLLHTWSLGIEEQYYIFFPFILAAIYKNDSKKYAKWLAALTLASFILCVAGMKIDLNGSFYMIPTRAWEFLIGSLLAINIFPVIRYQFISEALSIAGLIMLMVSIFGLTSTTPFPGVAATIPCIGAAMLIYSGTNGKPLAVKFLSLKPIVFIGVISYSLYLWHWPIIMYTKYYSIIELSWHKTALIYSLIFLLSIFSWRYIETPFRKKYMFMKNYSIFKISAIASASMICAGFILISTHGLPGRYNYDHEMSALNEDADWSHWEACQNALDKLKNNKDICDIGLSSGTPSFIFWGDSHAMALASAVNHSAKKFGLKGKIAIESACPPLYQIERPNRISCQVFNQTILQYIANNSNIKTVILSARWALSANGTRFKEEHGMPVKLIDLLSQHKNSINESSLFETGLRRTIDHIQNLGKSIVLVSQIPEIGYDVPSAAFISFLTGRNANSIISPSLFEYKKRTEKVYSIFSSLAEEKNVRIIDPSHYLCSNEYCNVTIDNIPLYRDDDHLSTYGSLYISSMFDGVFTDISNERTF